jgi:hypothetical protein
LSCRRPAKTANKRGKAQGRPNKAYMVLARSAPY